MPSNKKHHYVPKFVLKRFSENRKSINLFVIEREKKILSANLSNQCYKDYFYGADDGPEKALGVLETESAVIIDKICAQGGLPTDRRERFSLLLFIVMQKARTAAAADEFNEVSNQTLREVMKFDLKELGVEKDDVTIHLKEPALFSLHMALRTYPLLIDLDVRLIRNTTEEDFILSDNPVVYYNQLLNSEALGSTTGIASKGLQIFFPLDDKNVLFFFDGTSYNVPGERWSSVMIDDRRDIYNLNMLQVCSAQNVFYFKDSKQGVDLIYRKARRCLAEKLPKMRVLNVNESDDKTSRVIMMSRSQVRSNLSLTFVRVRKAAKQWRDWFRKPGVPRPAVAVRNPDLMKDYEEFSKLAEKGSIGWNDFFLFIDQKYPRQHSEAA